jgi:hypothetical protein
VKHSASVIIHSGFLCAGAVQLNKPIPSDALRLSISCCDKGMATPMSVDKVLASSIVAVDMVHNVCFCFL